MRQTSLEAYDVITFSGKVGERQKLVLDAFRKHGAHTDLEMVTVLQLKDANMLRPRRNELVKMGIIKEVDRRKCRISGRKAIVWGIKNG